MKRRSRRGLGEGAADEGWRVLGSLIEVAPTWRYNSVQVRRQRAALAPNARRLEEDLDWVRGKT
jgi:hypothetical protein